MTLWAIFASLLVVALAFVVWPLFQSQRRLTPSLAGLIVAIVAVSAGLYQQVGNPGIQSGPSEQPDVHAMVSQLEERLKREPEDVEGWLLLARSYETMEQYDKAAAAYEKVLEMAPMHPTALFYGGYIAAARGEYNLAADRWDAVLSVVTPPEDVRDSMEQQIGVWRGGEPAADSAPDVQDAIVTAVIALSDQAASSVPANATLFLIARDPEQPSPPIAVARRVLNAEPMIVELRDQDSMVPGRSLSGFEKFELLARISLSGNAFAQTGDWYGATQYAIGDDTNVEIVIDSLVE